ncbi:hypothetical protein EHQ27_11185 [Leptospira wolffii]|uniref:hypothetical protein n=1 Tax=Leptospira wolffii TaxID=409998 RepID=UPI001083CCAC|nr:hypothetical protein [Leptospira wolffii]TGK56933.1 hypothetical protein EHQ32_15265 [Leptospira wolffii]TGK70967.1 hypothetical protein EHQ27_11185 [Leptospira wolffii]TGK75658.1 hypothetical protein EHQ35_04635 [Leptospira wolffii]TGL32705.1 hypothetical protein EHQ57_01595 [Leptospira wolffii]
MKKALFVLILILVQCTTTVRVNTDPQGLDIYYFGQRMGKTPLEMEMNDGVFESRIFEIKKDRKVLRIVPVATEVKIPALIGGICFLFPFLWVVGPKSYQHYTIDEAFDKTTLREDSALVMVHLPKGMEMIVGTRVLKSEDSAYISGQRENVKLCDSEKCNDLGSHDFKNGQGYFYQLDTNRL